MNNETEISNDFMIQYLKNKDVIDNKIIAEKIKLKKGGFLFQLYKVDYDNPCLIGERNERGYCLRFWANNKMSNSVITEKNIQKMLQKECIEYNQNTMTIIN